MGDGRREGVAFEGLRRLEELWSWTARNKFGDLLRKLPYRVTPHVAAKPPVVLIWQDRPESRVFPSTTRVGETNRSSRDLREQTL